MTHDDLDRFLHAQADKYADALAELRAGRKQTHWMWYVFPQIAGLGQSAMARRYAIRSLAEARAYLAHPTLVRALRPASKPCKACRIALRPSRCWAVSMPSSCVLA